MFVAWWFPVIELHDPAWHHILLLWLGVMRQWKPCSLWIFCLFQHTRRVWHKRPSLQHNLYPQWHLASVAPHPTQWQHRWGLLDESVERDIGFCIYTIPLGTILQHYKFLYLIYGDDAQLYCSFDLDSPDEVLLTISTWISDIRTWMIQNKLRINDDKTELLPITSSRSKFTENIHLSIGKKYLVYKFMQGPWC